MSSESGEDGSAIPPSFLPLLHSHNLALDDIEKKRASVILEDEKPASMSASQEDLLNGNIDDKKEEQSCSTDGDVIEKNIKLTPNHVAFSDYSDDEKNQSEVLSLVPQVFVDALLNNNDNNSNNGSVQDLSKNSQDVSDQCSLNEGKPTNQFIWEFDQVFKTESTPVNDLPHASSMLEKPETGWKKITDGDGSYYWNIDTGVTQYEVPTNMQKHGAMTTNQFDSVDSSLADLEGAAFRYASLHIDDDNPSDREDSNEWTMSTNSDGGRMFTVRSLGWLPLRHFSTDPQTSSSAVNECIKQLATSHGQILDGVGSWGEGKDLLLLIEDEHLKLLDPVSQSVLQTQQIKQIRVWGVGGSNPHDFAYVSKDSVTRLFQCHVFRCDASAKAIARELHNVCEDLPKHKKPGDSSLEDEVDKEKLAMSTNLPKQKTEPGTKFTVKYMGSKKVDSVSGIATIKNVIRDVTTDDIALCEDSIATVSASALTITRKSDNSVLVNCRMRFLSFMGIGDDISLFAFIIAMAGEANCHVLQCQPNAAKLALSVQEACMLRLQKAVISQQIPDQPIQTNTARKSFRKFVKGIFSRKKQINSS